MIAQIVGVRMDTGRITTPKTVGAIGEHPLPLAGLIDMLVIDTHPPHVEYNLLHAPREIAKRYPKSRGKWSDRALIEFVGKVESARAQLGMGPPRLLAFYPLSRRDGWSIDRLQIHSLR